MSKPKRLVYTGPIQKVRNSAKDADGNEVTAQGTRSFVPGQTVCTASEVRSLPKPIAELFEHLPDPTPAETAPSPTESDA